MSDENYDIDIADSGASKTVSMEAGQIRKGGYIMIKGRPCKVSDVSTSKTGKHGMLNVNFQHLIFLLVLLVKNYALQPILLMYLLL